MTTLATKTFGPVGRLMLTLRLSYKRRRLRDVEQQIEHTQATVDAWGIDAQKMRVEVALLERVLS